jgi:APA family basic amino acid/polyamine antiporter
MNRLFRKKDFHKIHDDDPHAPAVKLNKILKVRDITALGIAAIIGAGIFSTIGTASADGGPGVIFLFLFTAITCSFAAFCYAEFASRYPVSGSAYSYAYASFGELAAWIIGWALIMEYAIGNITVAISWSDYLSGLLESMGIRLPLWMQMDWVTARTMSQDAESLIRAGKTLDSLPTNMQQAYLAVQEAPHLFSTPVIMDIPALFIIILITWLVYRGMKESRNASNLMVIVKLAVVLFVIVVGAFYVNTANWSPFTPNGIGGILKGVSAVFFAYIGFDAISTTAEECENPQRDLPKGMMYAILICTVLYVLIALVLTGMVPYNELGVGDPLAFVFSKVNLGWISGIIAVSALFAMASVLLVFQLGQPRIWMAMSRDGLLPKKFAEVHPKYKTPGFATIVTGFVVAVPALFLNLTTVTDLCSIGTLFAFVLVCAGVLMLEENENVQRGKFRIPYFNGRIYMPLLAALAVLLLSWYGKEWLSSFVGNAPEIKSASELITDLNQSQLETFKNGLLTSDLEGMSKSGDDVVSYLETMPQDKYEQLLRSQNWSLDTIQKSGWQLFKHKIPMWIFIFTFALMTLLSVLYRYSMIPVLGVLSCLYMMAQIPLKNWIGFTVWLIIGLIIYFSYSIRNSKLNRVSA